MRCSGGPLHGWDKQLILLAVRGRSRKSSANAAASTGIHVDDPVLEDANVPLMTDAFSYNMVVAILQIWKNRIIKGSGCMYVGSTTMNSVTGNTTSPK